MPPASHHPCPAHWVHFFWPWLRFLPPGHWSFPMMFETAPLIQKMAFGHKHGPGLSPVFSCILVERVIFVSLSVASALCGNPDLQVLWLAKWASLFTCLFWSLAFIVLARRPRTTAWDCPQVQPERSLSQLCMSVCRGGNCAHKGGLAGRKVNFQIMPAVWKLFQEFQGQW